MNLKFFKLNDKLIKLFIIQATNENAAQTVIHALATMNSTPSTSINTQPHTGRSMYRFENTTTNPTTNTSNTNSNNNNSLNRINIKRSVSQVPSTDRRPIATTNSSSNLMSTTPYTNTSPGGNTDDKIMDYQVNSFILI